MPSSHRLQTLQPRASDDGEEVAMIVPNENATRNASASVRTKATPSEDETYSTLATKRRRHHASTRSQSSWITRIQQLASETWLFELALTVLSVLCLVAIIGILVVYDGTAAPNLPSTVTLNAIVSILGTASKASLIFTVAASISQLKWVYFSKSRHLKDLQSFDDASRGPVGSITLLLIAIGAVIIISAVAFQFFLQQIITFATQIEFALNTAASTKQGTEFLVGALDMGFVEAVHAGLWSDPTQFEPEFACPTGNCTWSSFKTIGLCHKCEEAISRVRTSNCSMSATAQDFEDAGAGGIQRACGIRFSDTDGSPSITPLNFTKGSGGQHRIDSPTEQIWTVSSNTLDLNPGYTSLGVKNPIMSIGYVVFNGTPKGELEPGFAMECILDFCVREYSVTIESGRPSVTEVSQSFGETFDKPAEIVGGSRCWRAASDTPTADLVWDAVESNTTEVSDVPPKRDGFVDRADLAFCALDPRDMSGMNQDRMFWHWGSQLGSALSGNTDQSWLCSSNGTCDGVAIGTGDVRGFTATDNIRRITTIGIDRVLEGIAASLTKLLVDGGNGPQIAGEVGQPVTFVHVRWLWLILPVTLNLGGLGLLLLTMWYSRRRAAPLWKASVLPLLYHGLHDDFRNAEAGADGETHPFEKVSDMAALAEKTVVRLRQPEPVSRRITLGP